MILPTKRITHDRSLLGIGAEILTLLDKPKTVSRVWDELKSRRMNKKFAPIVIYDWFILALDVLYMLNAIHFEKGVLLRSQS
jgi:hypothetical protein